MGAAAGAARADLLELRWASSGYYRARAVFLTNLAPQDTRSVTVSGSGDVVLREIRRTGYVAHRLRLVPELRAGDHARLVMQIDALDDVVWGDNDGVGTVPLASTAGSNQGFLGGDESPSVEVSRVWLEVGGMAASLRVGRMPSHWGMGLIENGGGSRMYDDDPRRPAEVAPRLDRDTFFDDDFGDDHGGSTVDRALLMIRPGAIYRRLRHRAERPAALELGYGYGVVSEVPLLATEPLEASYRPPGEQGFLSRPGDDLHEHAFYALWDDPYWQPGGKLARDTDELRLGVRAVLRRAQLGSTAPAELDPEETCGTFEGNAVPCVDTGTRVWTTDAWLRFRYGPIYLEGEGAHTGGTTFGGLPFPQPNRKKRLDANLGVIRLGLVNHDVRLDPVRRLAGVEAYDKELWALEAEAGKATGDRDAGNERVTARAMHPDFNVGLILFEEVLRELSARTYGPPFSNESRPDGAVEMFSQGGVAGASYLSGKLRYHLPVADSRLTVGVLMAWADRIPGPATPGRIFGDAPPSSHLGTEIDAALKVTVVDHVELSIESGYLRHGDALRSVLPNATTSFTLQSRLAFAW
jgi:hypothetical protein